MTQLPKYWEPWSPGWGWHFDSSDNGYGYGYAHSAEFQIEDRGFGNGIEDGNGYGSFKGGKNFLNNYPEAVILL